MQMLLEAGHYECIISEQDETDHIHYFQLLEKSAVTTLGRLMFNDFT